MDLDDVVYFLSEPVASANEVVRLATLLRPSRLWQDLGYWSTENRHQLHIYHFLFLEKWGRKSARREDIDRVGWALDYLWPRSSTWNSDLIIIFLSLSTHNTIFLWILHTIPSCKFAQTFLLPLFIYLSIFISKKWFAETFISIMKTRNNFSVNSSSKTILVYLIYFSIQILFTNYCCFQIINKY